MKYLAVFCTETLLPGNDQPLKNTLTFAEGFGVLKNATPGTDGQKLKHAFIGKPPH